MQSSLGPSRSFSDIKRYTSNTDKSKSSEWGLITVYWRIWRMLLGGGGTWTGPRQRVRLKFTLKEFRLFNGIAMMNSVTERLLWRNTFKILTLFIVKTKIEKQYPSVYLSYVLSMVIVEILLFHIFVQTEFLKLVWLPHLTAAYSSTLMTT